MQRPLLNGRKCPFGCNGYVTAVAVGQRKRLYSGVRMFTWFYLSSINLSGWHKGPGSILGHWYVTVIPQRPTDTSVRSGVTVTVMLCNGRGRWTKATALFWYQNAYLVLSKLLLK
jgi:hypothetical protein